MKDYQYYGLFLDTDTKNMLMDNLTDNNNRRSTRVLQILGGLSYDTRI